MPIKFITGNKNKFKEVQDILAPLEIEQLDIELDEIQETDPHKILNHKLKEAFKHEKAEFIVEDTSLYFECFKNQLPGPFVKWFLKSIGPGGLADLAEKMGNKKAYAVALIAYAKNENEIHFFEGSGYGEIVQPRGDKDFGWGPIFVPEGTQKTFGEMARDEKYSNSMRGAATNKLKEFLLGNK